MLQNVQNQLNFRSNEMESFLWNYHVIQEMMNRSKSPLLFSQLFQQSCKDLVNCSGSATSENCIKHLYWPKYFRKFLRMKAYHHLNAIQINNRFSIMKPISADKSRDKVRLTESSFHMRKVAWFYSNYCGVKLRRFMLMDRKF